MIWINSINNFPSLVLVDPELSMSAPTSSVISSALDSGEISVSSSIELILISRELRLFLIFFAFD